MSLPRVIYYIYEDSYGTQFEPDYLLVQDQEISLANFLSRVSTADCHIFKNLFAAETEVKHAGRTYRFGDKVSCKDFNTTPEDPMVLQVKARVATVKYEQAAGGTINSTCTPMLELFQGLNFSQPLVDILNWLIRGEDNEAIGLRSVQEADVPKVLQHLSVCLMVHEKLLISEVGTPVTKNKVRKEAVSAHCVIHCCPSDVPVVLDGRLLHELTHGVRYLFSWLQNPQEPQQTTPEKEVPAELSGRYKMGSAFHSGYLAEHRLRGGVTVVLHGLFKKEENDEDDKEELDTGRVFRILESKEFRFKGERWSKYTTADKNTFCHRGNVTPRE